MASCMDDMAASHERTSQAETSISLDDIQSLEAFTKRYPDIANEARLRWWIFHREVNGLRASGALIKRNGRWFVVGPRMKVWLLGSGAYE